MKTKYFKYLAILFLLMVSCGGPDALVVNVVNSDGSVDRKVILTYHEDDFDLAECQVPVDSTWSLDKKMEVSEKGDTTWTLTAEKHFDSVEQINSDYLSHQGPNKRMMREAHFKRRFKWFNTVYRFEENIEAALHGIPPSEYFSPGELKYFYMPDSMIGELLNGEDSTNIQVQLDSLEKKEEAWYADCLLRGALFEIGSLNRTGTFTEIDTSALWNNMEKMRELIPSIGDNNREIFDTVFGKSFYNKHSVLIDSALSITEDKFNIAFEADDYLVQYVMPGSLIATNGYIDTESKVLWKVDGDTILASDYLMWAESKVSNRWAWIVSFLFVIFVGIGLFRKRKKTN